MIDTQRRFPYNYNYLRIVLIKFIKLIKKEGRKDEDNKSENRIDHCHDFDYTGFLLPDSIAGGSPLIKTDKDIYNYGEKIRVNFYNAPGYSRDWICIVPAGAPDTDAGDYRYIPRRGHGVLTFRARRPG